MSSLLPNKSYKQRKKDEMFLQELLITNKHEHITKNGGNVSDSSILHLKENLPYLLMIRAYTKSNSISKIDLMINSLSFPKVKL